VYIHKCFVE